MNFLSTVTRTAFSLLLLFGVTWSSDAQLSVSFSIEHPTCVGYTNGQVEAIAVGGQAPYSYAWSNGNTGAFLYGVGANAYIVTVTDNSGATVTAEAIVVDPDVLDLTIQGGDLCDGPNSTFTLVASGGAAPYSYTWDGAPSSATIVNPSQGYHYAMVVDANGCNTGAGISISNPLTVDVLTQNVVCYGYCDGTVEAKIDGGTAPYTFTWSNGATDQLVYGLDPGTYTVVVTDANGCTATDSGTLTEPDSISFSVSLADSCAGATTATVTAQGGTGNLTVRWSTGTIGTSAFLPEGQHYVYISDENGCEVSDRVIVSNGVADVVTMVTDATCDDPGEVLLCITGGRGPFTYIWSNGQSDILATGLAPGVYSYTIIDGGGCRFDGSVIVGGPSPADCFQCDADAGTLSGGITTDSICNNNAIDLLATVDQAPVVPSGFEVLYVLTSNPNNTILAVNSSPDFTVTNPGSYTIHTLVYDPTTFDLTVVVLGSTQAADVLTYILTEGLCASLDVPGTTFLVPECVIPLTCEGNPGSLAAVPVCFDGTSLTLSPDIVVAPDVPTGYELIYVLSQNGVILAFGADKDFDVSAAGNYSIVGVLFRIGTFDPEAIITLGQTTLLDLQGALPQCGTVAANGDGANFLVEEFDPAFANGLTDVVCPTDSVMLDTGGDPAYTYNWSPAGGLSDPSIANPMALLTETTVFTVTITQEVNGVSCSVDRTYTVNVSDLPTLNVSDDVITCDGGAVDLSATTQMGNDVIWSDSPDFSNVINTGVDFQVISGEPTIYYVQATNAAGCTTTSQVEVGDYPIVTELGAGYTICEGDDAQIETTVTSGDADSFELLGADGTSLQTNEDGLFTLAPSATETFTVVASNAAGCTDTTQLDIEVSSVGVELLAGVSGDTAIYPGMEVDLSAFSNGAISFEFENDPSYVTIGDSSATVLPTETTTYTVTATDEFGCTATSQIVVELLDFVCDRPYLFVPNAFSPDGDNVNETFYIDGVNIREVYYTIFNRWGEQVFESDVLGFEGAWDGTFNGQLVDPDVYGIYVRILCNDGEEFYTQGNVTVLQ